MVSRAVRAEVTRGTADRASTPAGPVGACSTNQAVPPRQCYRWQIKHGSVSSSDSKTELKIWNNFWLG